MRHRHVVIAGRQRGRAERAHLGVEPGILGDGEHVGQRNEELELLHDLELGDADLYATFEGDNVGVALGVNVDGDMQSYLLIDYKNLKILKENEVKLLNSL